MDMDIFALLAYTVSSVKTDKLCIHVYGIHRKYSTTEKLAIFTT